MILEEQGTFVRCKCDFCGEEIIKRKCFLSNLLLQFCDAKCSSNAKKKGNVVDRQVKTRSLKKNGVEHHLMLESTKKLREETNISRYGVANQFQRNEVISLIREHFQSRSVEKQNEIDAKFRATMFQRYGAVHPTHVLEIYDRMMKASVSNHENGFIKTPWKEFWFRSSYERRFLQWCVKKALHVDANIAIPYEFDGKNHIYWLDFYITLPSGKFACEVKPQALASTPINIAKQIAGKKWAHEKGDVFILVTEDVLTRLEISNELQPFLGVQ